MKKIFFYITIVVIALLSFRLYSSLFYPLLNSDNAVTILMLHYFKLPDDFYFWGQDRMGSLMPLLGQLFFKIFKLSAITSESITHYFILFFGYLSFSSFLKSHFYKIVFALIWFFPPLRLIEITQLSFGIHYSLIAICCFLFVFYRKEKVQNNIYFRHLVLTLIVLVAIIAIWVSDMAFISVFLLIVVNVFFYLRENRISFEVFKKVEVYYALFGGMIGYQFIHYAKMNSPVQIDYATFSEYPQIVKTFSAFIKTLSDFFTFNAYELLTSIYCYLVVLIGFLFISMIKKVKLDAFYKKWILFFLLDGFFLFLIIMTSKWTFLNEVPRRYFTCTYISISFALVMLLDNLQISMRYRNVLRTSLLVAVIVGGLSPLYNFKYVWPKYLTPTVEIASELESLGQIGIIADYWNSYMNSCNNPDLIKATPNESSYRSERMVEEVFKQKNIYIIKDMWLESFPDSITQFGRKLKKDGDGFRMANCDVCKYKVVK